LPTHNNNPSARLEKAKKLFTDGLIDEKEYAHLRQNILKDI